MQNEVMKKLGEHDKLFKKIDKRFDEHDKQFKKIDERFDDHTIRLDRLTKKALEHDDKFEELHCEIKDTKNTLMTKMDQILGVVNNLDTERYAMIAKTNRTEEKVEIHDKKIKKELKLA
jgi:hypothetical protein